MLQHVGENDCLKFAVLSNEAAFYISWYVNRHGCHVWGSEFEFEFIYIP
jgi:hypothetical protein